MGDAAGNISTGAAILGTTGNDLSLAGTSGNDLLTGNGGNDTFVFNTPLNSTTNVDTVADFNPVDDTFQFENGISASSPH